jgi:branched-chain amino acid aminotransferase
VLKANGLTDAYVRAVAWRGAGEDMGVSRAQPGALAIAAWEWGAYYGDAKIKGAKLDISKWKRPSPETIPGPCQGGRALHDLHHVQARGRGQGLFGRAVHGLPRLRGRGDRRQHLLRQGRRGAHALPDCFLNGLTRQTVIGMLKDAPDQGARAPHHARGDGRLRAVLADRHRGRGHAGGPDRRLHFEVGALTREIAEAYEALVRAVIGMDGRILKRGHDLKTVLRVLERKLIRVVD